LASEGGGRKDNLFHSLTRGGGRFEGGGSEPGLLEKKGLIQNEGRILSSEGKKKAPIIHARQKKNRWRGKVVATPDLFLWGREREKRKRGPLTLLLEQGRNKRSGAFLKRKKNGHAKRLLSQKEKSAGGGGRGSMPPRRATNKKGGLLGLLFTEGDGHFRKETNKEKGGRGASFSGSKKKNEKNHYNRNHEIEEKKRRKEYGFGGFVV